ncbi:MAG: S-methyl-5-thioribose-1-phosphate isomerase [Alphaproteobacteria bacterium]|nr:S-methyl-5-thioribose-1-phosphate isomerase [Alphaproteobacteria bacterium]
MRVDGRHYRSIWLAADGWAVEVIDQTKLPFAFSVVRLGDLAACVGAIRDMVVRGAPLIGATAAYGLCLALRHDASDASLEAAYRALLAARPTAVNLRWALDAVRGAVRDRPPDERAGLAYARAAAIAEDDVATCRAIGRHGLELLQAAWRRKGGDGPLKVLTHCNAGWLATVDYGTALAPLYLAHDAGLLLQVWVDETRPRNQGALTAWELAAHGVPHRLIVDNAGGHLMQRGEVDLCIVGTDRVTRQGDVCNKIGTYLKALAARDNGVPFYVALPHSTLDWGIADGLAEVPIEERTASEVTRIAGRAPDGERLAVEPFPPGTPAANPAFDVTPARLVTGFITERGICPASVEGLLSLYPERGT